MAGSNSSKDVARKAKKNSKADHSSQPLSIRKQLEALKEGREKGLGHDWQVVYNSARDIVVWICPKTGNSYDRLSKALRAAEECKQEELRRSKTRLKSGSSPASPISSLSSAASTPRSKRTSLSSATNSRSNQNRKPAVRTPASPPSQNKTRRGRPTSKSPKHDNITSLKTNKVARSSTTPQNIIVLSSSDTDDSSPSIRTSSTRKKLKRNPRRAKNLKVSPPKKSAASHDDGGDDHSSSSSEIYKWDDDLHGTQQKNNNSSKTRSSAAAAASKIPSVVHRHQKRKHDNAFPHQRESQTKLKKSNSNVHGESRITLADTEPKDVSSPASPTKRGRGRPPKTQSGARIDKKKEGRHLKETPTDPVGESPKRSPGRPKKKASIEPIQKDGNGNSENAQSRPDGDSKPKAIDIDNAEKKNGGGENRDLSPPTNRSTDTVKRGRGRPRRYPVSTNEKESVATLDSSTASKSGHDRPRNTTNNESVAALDSDNTSTREGGSDEMSPKDAASAIGSSNVKNGEGGNRDSSPTNPPTATKKRGRGRPRKYPISTNNNENVIDALNSESSSGSTTQKPGHDPKNTAAISTNHESAAALNSDITSTRERGGDEIMPPKDATSSMGTSDVESGGGENRDLSPTMATKPAGKGAVNESSSRSESIDKKLEHDTSPNGQNQMTAAKNPQPHHSSSPTTGNNTVSNNAQASVAVNKTGQPFAQPTTKRGRGRPRKNPVTTSNHSATALDSSVVASVEIAPKAGHDRPLVTAGIGTNKKDSVGVLNSDSPSTLKRGRDPQPNDAVSSSKQEGESTAEENPVSESGNPSSSTVPDSEVSPASHRKREGARTINYAEVVGKVGESLPTETVEYLKAWIMSPEHIDHPYPTKAEKAKIMADTGIERKQLENWLVNNRQPHWKPAVDKIKEAQSIDGKAKSIHDNSRQTQTSVSDLDTKPKAIDATKATNRGPGRPQKSSMESREGKKGEGVSRESSSIPPVTQKRSRGNNLPKETVEYLKAWMMSPEHIDLPYPNEAEKAKIMADTGIEPTQLKIWLVNNRQRYWKPTVAPKSGRGRPPKNATPSRGPKGPQDDAKRGRGRPKKRRWAIPNNSTHLIDESDINHRTSHGGEENDKGVKRKRESSENKENGDGTNANIADARGRSYPLKGDFDDNKIGTSSYVYPPWLPHPDPREKFAFLQAHKKYKSDTIMHPPRVENIETNEDERASNHEALEHDHNDINYFAASNKTASHTLFDNSAPIIKCKQRCPEWMPKTTIAIDANNMDALIQECANTYQKEKPNGPAQKQNKSTSNSRKPAADSQGTPSVTTIDSDMDFSPPIELFSNDSNQRRVTRGMQAKSKGAQEHIWDKFVQKIIKNVDASKDGYWV